MNASPPLSLTPRDLVRLLVSQRLLWLVPAISCGLLAAVYSLVMPRYWEASQALVVRQETAGSQGPTPGKFADLYEMRTMQETILELAKSREVVVATIKAVDQRMIGAATEPSAEDIEKFRGRLKMLPPDGGEFGKTEVFYFYLKDANRDRAMELVGELCRQLDVALKELRAKRAEGLIAELEEQVALALEIHAEETKRLTEFEAEVGGDLGELRMLHSAASGQSDLRQEIVQLEGDARKFATQLRESEQLLALLRAAEKDPQQLLATPTSLLASQPALRRLKDGLVDAQLATARLGGTRSAEHPRVKAAIESEKEIRADLHRELITAVRAAEAEVRLSQQRLEATRARLNDVEGRLDRLAERRAEYSNRVAAVDNTRVTLDRARQNLSTAKAAEAAARSGSLVTRIDKPETGPYPAGPGRTVITAAGGMGGLMLGLGLVFLTAGPSPAPSGGIVGVRVEQGEGLQRDERPRVQEREPQPLFEEPIPAFAYHAPPRQTIPPTAKPEPSPLPVRRSMEAPVEPTSSSEPVEPTTWNSWAPEPSVDTSSLSAVPPSIAPSTIVSAATDGVAHESATRAGQADSTVHVTPAVASGEGFARQAEPASADHPPVQVQSPLRAQPQPVVVPGPTKKTILPTATGKLPSAAGALPLASTPAVAGMSLQEALQAARLAQR